MATSRSKPIRLTERLHRAVLVLPFAFLLLIPKALSLRRRRQLWNTLRILVAIGGAWLLAKGIADWNGVPLAGGGLLIGLAAALRPVGTGKTLDELKQELGALVTVNGGFFTPPKGRPRRVHLMVGAERVHLVDSKMRIVREFALESFPSLRVEAEKSESRLIFQSGDRQMVLQYKGFFAEHLARVAENTIQRARRSNLTALT